MSYSVVFHISAIAEYQEASLWYEQQKESLGMKFEEAIDNKIAQIKTDPFTYPRKKGAFRQAIVHGFPFIIVYTIAAKSATVYVSAVFHTSRNPKMKYRKF